MAEFCRVHNLEFVDVANTHFCPKCFPELKNLAYYTKYGSTFDGESKTVLTEGSTVNP